MLSRRLTSYPWNSANSTAQFLADVDRQVDADTGTSSLDAIGETIMRMAVIVHKSDGTVLEATSAQLPGLDSFQATTRSNSVALDLDDVDAITVAFASLDARSQILAADQLGQIAQALPGPTAAELARGILPVDKWSGVNWDSLTGVPPAMVRENIRFYQRTFPIHAR